MITATLIFHGCLNDLLARDQRDREIILSFASHQTVKHLIESLGIPHVEVGSLHSNGVSISWDYRPHQDDRLEINPSRNCPADPRFLLDNHLGRLAAYLRMLGFDSLYENTFSDAEMAAILETDHRILLTRDRRLLMRKVVLHGYCLRSRLPYEQLSEVVHRYQLHPLARPFHRCLRCNHELEQVDKSMIWDQLEPKTKLYYNEFSRCPACHQVYWKGSHYERMQDLIAEFSD